MIEFNLGSDDGVSFTANFVVDSHEVIPTHGNTRATITTEMTRDHLLDMARCIIDILDQSKDGPKT